MMSERISPKMSAHQKPSTSNPGTSAAVNMMIRALITSRNMPKVRMVRGMVRMIKMGFRNVLSSDNTTATSAAVRKPSTATPGRINVVISTASAETNKRINIFILPILIFVNLHLYRFLQIKVFYLKNKKIVLK